MTSTTLADAAPIHSRTVAGHTYPRIPARTPVTVAFLDETTAAGRIVSPVDVHNSTYRVRMADDGRVLTVHRDNFEEDSPRIITNNVPRDVIDAWELSESERESFDYLDWDAIERGEDSASFFRYRGTLYDLGEFTSDYGITRGTGLPAHLARWDGYLSESFFSAIVVRYVNDYERVIVGLVLS